MDLTRLFTSQAQEGAISIEELINQNPAPILQASDALSENNFLKLGDKAQPNASGSLILSIPDTTGIPGVNMNGYERWCNDHPELCGSHVDKPGTTVIQVFSDRLIDTLRTVNSEINAYPARDDDASDLWQSIAKAGAGDCDDYVIAKFEALKDKIDPASMSMITVFTPEDQAHEVLGVLSSKGVIILDNLKPEPMFIGDTGYTIVGGTTFGNTSELRQIAKPDVLVPDPMIDDIIRQNEKMYAPLSAPADLPDNIPIPRQRPPGL